MNDKDFFRSYLPALEKALANDADDHGGFSVWGPDWYVEDADLVKEMDLFEDENFKEHGSLFQSVALYFDAKSHGFPSIDGIPIDQFKERLKKLAHAYKERYVP